MESSTLELKLKGLEKSQKELESKIRSLSKCVLVQSHDLSILETFVALRHGDDFRQFRYENSKRIEKYEPVRGNSRSLDLASGNEGGGVKSEPVDGVDLEYISTEPEIMFQNCPNSPMNIIVEPKVEGLIDVTLERNDRKNDGVDDIEIDVMNDELDLAEIPQPNSAESAGRVGDLLQNYLIHNNLSKFTGVKETPKENFSNLGSAFPATPGAGGNAADVSGNISAEWANTATKAVRIGRPKISEDTRKRKFQCEFCENRYLSKVGLRAHERKIHRVNYNHLPIQPGSTEPLSVNQQLSDQKVVRPNYQCPSCQETFNGSQKIREHKETCKKNINSTPMSSTNQSQGKSGPNAIVGHFHCQICRKTFLREGNLHRHMRGFCGGFVESGGATSV